jgi:cysteine desulfurase/selenocysteine lyase
MRPAVGNRPQVPPRPSRHRVPLRPPIAAGAARPDRCRAGVPRPVGADWVVPHGYELRPDARRFENWESNLAAVAGLRAAVAYARSWGLDAIAERVGTMAEGLRDRLAEVPGVRVHGLGRRRSGIVTFTVDRVAADDVRAGLRGQGINVSVSEPSSTRLDADRRRLPPLVRASVHYVTTDAELDRLAIAVGAMAAGHVP